MSWALALARVYWDDFGHSSSFHITLTEMWVCGGEARLWDMAEFVAHRCENKIWFPQKSYSALVLTSSAT